jgi:hypothetical protein
VIIDNFADLKVALERNVQRDEARKQAETEPSKSHRPNWCHVCGYAHTCSTCQSAVKNINNDSA